MPSRCIRGQYSILWTQWMTYETPVADHSLWQDMSQVPPGVAAAWEKEFERSVKRKRSFGLQTPATPPLLHLRDFVSTAASDLADVATAAGDVKSSLATWPAWK